MLRGVVCRVIASAIPAYELVGNLANLRWFVVIGAPDIRIVAILIVGCLFAWAALQNAMNRRAFFGATYLMLDSLFLSVVTRPNLV